MFSFVNIWLHVEKKYKSVQLRSKFYTLTYESVNQNTRSHTNVYWILKI